MMKRAAVATSSSGSGSGSSSVTATRPTTWTISPAKRQASLSAFLTPQPKSKRSKTIQAPSPGPSSPLRAKRAINGHDAGASTITEEIIVIDGNDDGEEDGTLPVSLSSSVSKPLNKGKGKAKQEVEEVDPVLEASTSMPTATKIHPLFGGASSAKSVGNNNIHQSTTDEYPELDLSEPWPPKNHPYHLPPNPRYGHPIVLPPLPLALKQVKYNTKGKAIKDEKTELNLVYFKRFLDSSSTTSGIATISGASANGSSSHAADPHASSSLSPSSSSDIHKNPAGSSLPSSKGLMKYLLEELPWYRVKYTVRGININTPRYTTVFGKDSTDIPWTGYQKCQPRAIPEVLLNLMRKVEQVTSAQYNFCLVNYYSNGDDSISYHSDSESFLGPNPTIASLSLGASRDFFLRHVNHKHHPRTGKPVDIEKFELADGDMVVMRGRTQHEWMHSIPKRKNAKGRINITFRKGVVRYATENYNNYNVGKGPMYRWDKENEVMVQVEA